MRSACTSTRPGGVPRTGRRSRCAAGPGSRAATRRLIRSSVAPDRRDDAQRDHRHRPAGRRREHAPGTGGSPAGRRRGTRRSTGRGRRPRPARRRRPRASAAAPPGPGRRPGTRRRTPAGAGPAPGRSSCGSVLSASSAARISSAGSYASGPSPADSAVTSRYSSKKCGGGDPVVPAAVPAPGGQPGRADPALDRAQQQVAQLLGEAAGAQRRLQRLRPGRRCRAPPRRRAAPRTTRSCSGPDSSRGAGSPRATACARSSPNAYEWKVRASGSRVVRASRRGDPLPQLGRGPPAERQQQQRLRVDAGRDPGGRSLDQRGRLAAARAGEHEQRAAGVVDDGLLPGLERRRAARSRRRAGPAGSPPPRSTRAPPPVRTRRRWNHVITAGRGPSPVRCSVHPCARPSRGPAVTDRGGELPEPDPPARVGRGPAELPLGLRVRHAAGRGHHHHEQPADQRSGQPAGHVPGRRRPDLGGQHRQPLPHRGGLVVGDVVEPGRAPLDRRRGGRGRVVDVQERPDPGAVADDGEPALADHLDVRTAGARATCPGRRSRRTAAQGPRRTRSPPPRGAGSRPARRPRPAPGRGRAGPPRS